MNIRLDTETLRQLSEIAEDLERSKVSVLTRAVREYIERKYAVLEMLRESDHDIREGRTVSNDELKAWLQDAAKIGSASRGSGIETRVDGPCVPRTPQARAVCSRTK